MLDAWARGKGNWNHPLEDEVLSAIFGHLRYLSLPARKRATLSVLRGAFEGSNFSDTGACDIELWPNLVDHGRVEPDVVITFGDRKAPSLVLLIEAKWEAAQGQNQLADQWKAARQRYPNAELWHLFLTKRIYTVEEMLGRDRDDLHQQRLRSATWSWLAQRLQAASQDARRSITFPGRDEFQSWVDTACEFCARLGQARFEGVAAVVQRHGGVLSPNTWYFHERLIHAGELVESARNVITLWRHPTWKFQASKQ